MMDFGRWYRAYAHEKRTEGPKKWNDLRNYLVETGVDASSLQKPGEWGCVPIWGYHFDNVYAGEDKTIVLYEKSIGVEGGLVTTFMGAVYEFTAEEFANMMDGMSQAEKKARDEAAGQAEENPAEGVAGEQ